MSEKLDYVKYVASVLLFGSNGIVAAQVNAESAAIVFWRTLLGSLLLIAVFVTTKRKLTVHKSKRDTLFMLLSGVSTGLSWIFLYEAYRLTGVGVSTVIYYLGPVAVMVLSPSIFKERLTPAKVLCLAVVLVGAILLNGESLNVGAEANGIIYALASVACHAVMVVFNKLASGTKGLENPMLQVSISFLAVALFCLAAHHSAPALPSESVIPMVLLGLVNTGLGCYLYFSALGGMRAQSIVVLGYLEPLSAVVFAVLLLGEPMTSLQTLGTVLVIGGALAAECMPSDSTLKERQRQEG